MLPSHPAAADHADRSGPGSGTTQEDFTVLLVEDSRLLAERLLELITDMRGVRSLGAVSTESAGIEAVQRGRPDLVLLDLRLQQGTGFGVMRYINTLPGRRPVVIVLTNYALPQYRREAEILGARHFLDKSTEFEQIPDLITRIRCEHPSGLR